jgi:hypothetical protein
VSPFKKPPHGALTAAQKESNRSLNHCRNVIENFNSALKKWAVFKSRFLGTKLEMAAVVTVIVNIIAHRIQHSPLRPDEW